MSSLQINTHKINAGTWKTLNLRAVAAPVVPRLTLAKFTLFFKRAATASKRACNLWQSIQSFV